MAQITNQVPVAQVISRSVPGVYAKGEAKPSGEVQYNFGGKGGLEEVLRSSPDGFYMEQTLDLFEAFAEQIGFPCVEQANQYTVYNVTTREPLLYFKEDSQWFERCCCKPFHKANIYAYDIRQDSPNPGQVLLQVHKPFKCGCCPAWLDFCQAEASFFSPESMDQKEGYDPSGESYYGTAKIPQCGGWFTPTVEINSDTQSKVTGPFCVYGGCTEFCLNQTFNLHTTTPSGVATTDGGIRKLRPRDMSTAVAEGLTDMDKFELRYPAQASSNDRASLLGTMILLDYLFFETGAPITFFPKFECTLCNMYCCGASIPCTLSQGDGEGGE